MNQPSDSREEFYQLACVLLRVLIGWATSKTAERLARRIGYLSEAVIIPASCHGSIAAVQAIFDLSYNGADQLLKRNQVPAKKPGQELLYRFADLAETPKKTDAKSLT